MIEKIYKNLRNNDIHKIQEKFYVKLFLINGYTLVKFLNNVSLKYPYEPQRKIDKNCAK